MFKIHSTDEENYHFYEEFYFEDALVMGHYDLEEDISIIYETLSLAAEVLDLKLTDDFYHINLDVYGDTIIDVCDLIKVNK